MSEDAVGSCLLFGAIGVLIGEYGFGHALAGLIVGLVIGALAALLAHAESRKRSIIEHDRPARS